MASVAQPALAVADGYRVLAAPGRVGVVEELWFGEREEPLALVVRLTDDRRGLLLAEDVAGVSPEDRSLTISPAARLLHLDPPHLETRDDGRLAASWRATDSALVLPEPHARLRGLLPSAAPHPVTAIARERPLWRTVLVMLCTLALIVGSLIALDFLFAYAITGGPPY
jgi:hypothetical protein